MANEQEPHSPDELRSVSSITAKPKTVQRLGKRAIFLGTGIAAALVFVIVFGVFAASNAQNAKSAGPVTPVVVAQPSKDDAAPPSDITNIPTDRLPTSAPGRMDVARRVASSNDGYVLDANGTPIVSVTVPPMRGTPNLEAAPTYQDTVTRNIGTPPQAPVTSSRVDLSYVTPPPGTPGMDARADAATRARQEETQAQTSDIIMRPAGYTAPAAEQPTQNAGSAPAAAAMAAVAPRVGARSASLMGGNGDTGPIGAGTEPSTADAATAAQLEKLAFLSAANTPSTLDYLGTVQRDAISPYEIVAGKVIPVALVTGITSDIPGLIVAQVRKDIYDSRSGRYCLVPKGATLIAEPDTRVVAGQRRIVVAFSRIIFPDTSSQDINGFQGADLNGYAGLSGKAITHLNRILGKAILEAVLAGAVNRLSTSGSNNTTVTTSSSATNPAGQIITSTDSSLSGTAPTIEIPEGYRFNVVVNRDWLLRGPWTGSCSG